jgi:hypothetical protein
VETLASPNLTATTGCQIFSEIYPHHFFVLDMNRESGNPQRDRTSRGDRPRPDKLVLSTLVQRKKADRIGCGGAEQAADGLDRSVRANVDRVRGLGSQTQSGTLALIILSSAFADGLATAFPKRPGP